MTLWVGLVLLKQVKSSKNRIDLIRHMLRDESDSRNEIGSTWTII